MANIEKELAALFSASLIKTVSSDFLQISQLNLIISVLIKAGIPFDISFSPGTRRAAPAAVLTVYINPSTTINFTISFE